MGGNEKTFEEAINNIKKCVEINKKQNLNVTIGMQMVLIDDCVDQIVPQAALGQDLGVDYFVVKQTSESGSTLKESVQHGLVP